MGLPHKLPSTTLMFLFTKTIFLFTSMFDEERNNGIVLKINVQLDMMKRNNGIVLKINVQLDMM
ncbi:unnamed protein product, partial [Schistosoma haematobium]